MNTMTLSLARVLGPEIRVNAVAPGLIVTRWLRDGWGEKRFNAAVKHTERNTPLQHATTAEDVAETTVFLLEGSRVVTGEIIKTDAGFHLGKL